MSWAVAMSERPMAIVRSCGRLQGGSCSRTSSPAGSPKSVVGTFDIDTLAASWDDLAIVRERMRNGQNLLLHYDPLLEMATSNYVDATVDNLRIDAEILHPLLCIMKDHSNQLPAINKLINAVEEVYRIAKLSRTPDHFYQQAWAVRRLISKLKRFTYRPLPPQDLSS